MRRVWNSKGGISRRTLIECMATLTGLAAAGGAASEAFAQAKISQQTAQYQNKPNGKQACAGCVNFMAPSSCKVVDGKISPNGWCMLFTSKSG